MAVGLVNLDAPVLDEALEQLNALLKHVLPGDPIPAQESPRRAGDPAVLVASSEKIRQVLGWNPQHSSVENIVRTAWEWHKTHPQPRG